MTRVLVVEDSLTVVGVVEWILHEQGLAVTAVHDGMGALAAVRALFPDMVLLDIMLPHVNGFDVCETIRKNPAYANIPVIMMSGLSSPEDIQRAYDVGADSYIKKPVTEEKLLPILNKFLLDDLTA